MSRYNKKDKFYDDDGILGLNAIQADNNYYTKAIIDYLFVRKLVEGSSRKYMGTPEVNNRLHTQDTLIPKYVLFPQLQQKYETDDEKELANIDELRKLGLNACLFDIPLSLNELQSGFQFNHYVFRSKNRAAMQAFGIVDSDIHRNSLYIVTDYLQYQDFHCSRIPTIRYAVGMRAEFRIADIESLSELKGVGSLAGLAAEVETEQQQVNITVKTIGITGLESRVSIPSNTTFDVKTYSDYESVISFIRKDLRDYEELPRLRGSLEIHPEIVPVMDEYRTSLDQSFYSTIESIDALEIKLKEYREEEVMSEAELEEMQLKINQIKKSLVTQELDNIDAQRRLLAQLDVLVSDFSDIIKVFQGLEASEYINVMEVFNKSQENRN